MPKPGADPHGGIEDFANINNPNRSGHADEMR